MTSKRSDEDTIIFPLVAKDTVVNRTVKVIATINGMIDTDLPESVVQSNVEAMMARFIPQADWKYAQSLRSKHPSGREQLIITATTRVADTENRNLEERSVAAATKIGIAIANISVDHTIPQTQIDDTEIVLMKQIVEKATIRCEAMNAAMQAAMQYRISHIVFGNEEDGGHMRKAAMSMAMAAPVGGGHLRSGSTESLGHSQEFMLSAQVTLSRPAQSPKSELTPEVA